MVTTTVGSCLKEELYTKTWLPDGPPQAKLVLLHGFSDHVDLYDELNRTLAARGIAVYGFDQRGWGRSVHKASDKGLTGPTAQVLDDIAGFIKTVFPKPNDADSLPPAPVFVLAHSMGGNEAATLMASPVGSALERDVVRHVRGWLLEAPFFGFAPAEAPSWLKVAVGRLAGRLLPRFQLKNPIPPEHLTRDPAFVEKLRNDRLCHDTGTLEGLAHLLDRVANISEGRCPPAASVRSVWLGHGDADKTVSFDASRKWFDESAAAVPDKTFRRYEGYAHQLHTDLGREVFFQDVGDWILARTDNGDGTAGEAPGRGEAAPEATGAVGNTEAAETADAVSERLPKDTKL